MAQLNRFEQARLDQAKQALAASQAAPYDVMTLAEHNGALEWNLTELIKLVDQLTGNA
jgi:hypothetical protein